MHGNDEIRFRHMLDAAYAARRLAQGRKRRDPDVDEGLMPSLVKVVEMIGEAATANGLGRHGIQDGETFDERRAMPDVD